MILIYALAVSVALNIFFAIQIERYIVAFRDTATKLWNVTKDRDKLHIQNTGLKAELARECVKNEELSAAIEERYNAEIKPHVDALMKRESVSTLKPEHRE